MEKNIELVKMTASIALGIDLPELVSDPDVLTLLLYVGSPEECEYAQQTYANRAEVVQAADCAIALHLSKQMRNNARETGLFVQGLKSLLLQLAESPLLVRRAMPNLYGIVLHAAEMGISLELKAMLLDIMENQRESDGFAIVGFKDGVVKLAVS